MSIRNNEKGFTLLEILIVLIILGVIAGLAIPAFQGQVERGRAQEAYQNITHVRDSLGRYFANNNTFVGATLSAACAGGGTLDYTPNCAAGNIVPTNWFNYAVGGLGAATYTVTATRTAASAGNCNGQTIVVNQSGTPTLGACYA